MQPEEIEALVAAGRYAEAAAAFRTAGRLDRAQALYEKIWDFRSAAEVARERGDRPELLRLLVEAKELVEAARVGAELLRGGGVPDELERVAQIYEKKRMWGAGAEVREALGQLEAAHALYLKGQQLLEAARLDDALGRPREAGVLLERFLAEEPQSGDAPRARLALARILAGFARHEEAVRQLQRALPALGDEGQAELRRRARRLLCCELYALGYRDGAALLLDELRAEEPALPGIDAFVREERRGLSRGGGEARLAGRYVVGRLLGSGGMGRVYLARDVLTGKNVAVKVVAPPTDERLAQGYRRFVREATIVSSLSHPNLVALVAFHEAEGLLAMEYLEGGTLADRLPGPLSPGRVRTMLLQLLAGLETAHAHGVIHRDIKPANVFFTAAGDAKLGDFGVAHLQDLGATQTAGFIGTLGYMSPEQITGARLTFAADIYALGATAFQALTGRLPFTGPDFVAQHLGDAPPGPRSLRPELDPAWDEILLRALEKDPARRFASLEELRHAVGRVRTEAPALRLGSPATSEAPVEPRPASRYQLGSVVAEGVNGRLSSATDVQLGREVVIERFAPGFVATPEGQAHLTWLRRLARHGGPGLQRVLALDSDEEGGLSAVFESPVGRLVSPTELLARHRRALAEALAPVHAEGGVHGSVAASVLLEDHGPTLLIAGRQPPDDATPADDLAALG